ncbi:MAG: inositol monophosphatase [bacterium]|nr:inositol monophosphatase [bacterium]
MLHTVIETTLYPKKKSVNGLTRLLTKTVKKAGKRTKKYFHIVETTKDKDERTLIRSNAEKDSRKIILDTINNSRLCDVCAVSTENAGQVKSSHSFTLVVDALDGMNNFRLGIPNYSVSAAILKGEEIVFAVVYHPILDSIYVAHKGKGAFKNGKPMSVNNVDSIQNATISYIHEHRRIPAKVRYGVFGGLVEEKVKRFMMDRSPSNNFCLLAEGKIEAIMCNQESLFDFCAGKLIAQEAGALTTYMDPLKQIDTNNTFVISNRSQLLNRKLTEIFKKYV